MINDNVPITGVGSQSHFSLVNFPGYDAIEQSIVDLGSLGIDVMVTELDLNVLPTDWNETNPRKAVTDIYKDGLPKELSEEFTDTYKNLFELYLKHNEMIKRVTFWGISDSSTWLNYLPIERINYSLLFDRENEPKPAFHALIDVANNHVNGQE
jgi:endo-1,4-beta-xylanase